MWQSIVTFLNFYLYTMFCRTNVFRKKSRHKFFLRGKFCRINVFRTKVATQSFLCRNFCRPNVFRTKVSTKFFPSKMQKSLSSCCADNCKRTLSDEWTFWMKKIDFRFFSDERNEDSFTYNVMSQHLMFH